LLNLGDLARNIGQIDKSLHALRNAEDECHVWLVRERLGVDQFHTRRYRGRIAFDQKLTAIV